MMSFSVLADNALDMLDPSGLPVEYFYRSFVSLQLVLDSTRFSGCDLIEIIGGHCDKLQLQKHKSPHIGHASGLRKPHPLSQLRCLSTLWERGLYMLVSRTNSAVGLAWVLVNRLPLDLPLTAPTDQGTGLECSVAIMAKRLMLNKDFQSCW